jgi:ribosomal protein L29
MTEDRLRDLSDAELVALVVELEERAEQFDARTRLRVNDELRRRRLPLIGFGRSRH